MFSNTHILVPEFELITPHTIEEAAGLAGELPSTALMAGGTDLLVQMKMEQRTPSRVIHLGRIPGLDRVTDAACLDLGATASIRTVGSTPGIVARYTALAEACQAFSTVQITVMGTIGGNVCNASPAADTAPALLVLDAVARVVSTSRSRDVPINEFFVAPGRTVLEAGEILESIRVPRITGTYGSTFFKMSRVTADISKVSVAVSLVRDGDSVEQCRIALGAVAATPLRATGAEATLTGAVLTESVIEEAAGVARGEITPISDVRSTATYRRQVAGVLVGDAIRSAWARSGGGVIR
ncbi:MAG: xanthine dehydrogenase family protein subunit M [Actinobacteria bacterium]|nr:xanthine dehydrogenase family protein subunit M [Actinomycetota bacterium]